MESHSTAAVAEQPPHVTLTLTTEQVAQLFDAITTSRGSISVPVEAGAASYRCEAERKFYEQAHWGA